MSFGVSQQTLHGSPVRQNVDAGFTWRLKRSFINYVARTEDGRCSVTDGAEFQPPMDFFYPAKNEQLMAPIGSSFELSFVGDVRFAAHKGMLFVRIGFPKLIGQGTHGDIWVLADPADHTETTHLAECDLDITRNDKDFIVGLIGKNVKLTEAGAEIFGLIYKPGESLEDFSISLRVTES